MAATKKPQTETEDVPLMLNRNEALQLFEILKHTEALANTLDPKLAQRRIGSLLKKVARVVGKIV
jgi:hypothetical protein